MTEVMTNGFCLLSEQEMNLIDGGGWVEAGQAFLGIVLIGISPAVGIGVGIAAGPIAGVAAGVAVAAAGSSLIGSAAH